jgi:hypothetical protein
MEDNSAFLKLCSSADKMLAKRMSPPENVTVTCEYCDKQFVTSKGGTDGSCHSCGAPVRKGPRPA